MRPSLAFGFVVFAAAITVAALFVVFGTFTSGSPLRQGFMATAIGGLFVLAALLISGGLRLEVRNELWELAEHYGLDSGGNAETLRRRILVHLERERSSGGTFTPAETTGSHHKAEDANAQPPPLAPGPLGSFDREIPRQLVKEGKYLLALAKLFQVDVKPYREVLARVHRAAKEGRYEEWLEAMQEGNERLRSLLEETPPRES